MFVQFKETYPCFITKENKTKKKKKCYIEQGLGLVPVNIIIPLHPLRQKEFTRRGATDQFRTSVLVLTGGLCLQVLNWE